MLRKTVYTLLLASVTLLAVETDTNVIFGEEINKGQDQYGNNVYERAVTIQTTNFKVDNFWKKFSWGGSGTTQENFDLISTSGTVQINVEGSFACKDGGLDSTGCSGQKPFLLNQGVLENPDLKKDALGNDLAAGEYRIPFNSAKEYNTTANDAFYPIDVYRDGIYYQETVSGDETADKPKTFFGFMVKMFMSFFSSSTAESLSQVDSPEVRNRYIANITYGLQKDYLIPKNSAIYTNEVNTADSTKRVSLVDYNEEIIEGSDECNVFFFTFTSGSSVCKGVSFFGLSSFIPFITNSSELRVVPAIVAEDTESTLLTLAGKLDGVNYVTEKMDPNTGTTFLTEIFKPMTFMFDSMMKFFFGSTAKELTQVVMLDFNFTNPMALTFLETDGSTITDFKYFTLLGLESVYGTEVESCTVKRLTWWMMIPVVERETYYRDTYTNTEFDLGTSYVNYPDLNVTTTTTTTTTWTMFGPKTTTTTTGVANVSNDDWLDWCMRNKDNTSTSWLFDMFSFMIPTLGSTEGGATYDEQLDTLIDSENWKVDEFQSKVHKGLILHLKESQNGFTPEMSGTTSTYKLMNIQRGN